MSDIRHKRPERTYRSGSEREWDRFARKIGFFDKNPTNANAIALQHSTKEYLGNLGFSKIIKHDAEGNTIISKTTPVNQKIIYHKKKKEEAQDLVLVYTGPNNDFSEYTAEDLTKRCKQFWNTIPQKSLATLSQKKLLVLPCPKRALTSQEQTDILKFLENKTWNRAIVFCGNDATSANSIMTLIDTKLEFAEHIDEDKYFTVISSRIPINEILYELVWYPATTSAMVVVKEKYWSEAVLKDWHGFGISYEGINSLTPYATYNQYELSDGFMAGCKGYGYTTELANFSWSFDGWAKNPSYKPEYITWDYTGKDKDDLLNWCAANKDNLPIVHLDYNNDPKFEKTYYKYNYYLNFGETQTILNYWNGSRIAYVTGENIIAAGFEPSWLSDSLLGHITDLDKTHPIHDFSDWALWTDFPSAPNLFNTNSKFVQDVPYYYLAGGGGGWVPPIQT